ncbi:MAG: alkaline phosphatase family protein, partial [Thermobifida sp.]|nr:alkaline phosphatase family protein [Thermobifida sp.]
MSERALTLDLPGADLPGTGDPVITDVIAGALSSIDTSLPGASSQAAGALGIEAGADQVLLILVDGLGYELIQDHLGHTPTLRRVRDDIRSIHTVVPSTTAAAITAFGTGARPGVTNMVGFSVAYGGGVMNLLAMEGGPAPTEWQPTPTYFERLAAADVSSAVISPARFAGSGLTGAALRGARHVPAEALSDRVSAALRELRAGTPLVYLYWSEIDHAGHSSGVGSDAWIGCLEEFDAGLSALLRGLPAGVRTVMTADHGMINVEHSALVDVAATPALREGVRIVAGETRAVHVHAQEGRAADVEARWRDTLGERAWILSRDQMSALIGPGDGASIIGDLLV